MSATAFAPQVHYGNALQTQFNNASVAGAVVSHPPTMYAQAQQYVLPQSAGYAVAGHPPTYIQQAATNAAPAATAYLPQSPATAAPTSPPRAIGTQSVALASTTAYTEVQSHPMVESQAQPTYAASIHAFSQASVQPGTMTYVTDAAQTSPSLESLVIASYESATTQAAPVTYVVPQQQAQYTPTLQAPMVSYQQYAHVQQPIGLPMAHSMVAYPAGTGLLQPQVPQPELAPQVSVAPAEALNEVATASAQAQVSQASFPPGTITYVTDAAQTAPTLESLVTASHQAATTQAAPVTYSAPQHQVHYAPTLHAPVVSYQQYAHLQQPTGLPMAHSMVAYPAGTGLLQPQATQPEDAPQVSAAPADALNEEATASAQGRVNETAPTKKTSKKTKTSKKKSKNGCC